MIPPLAPDNRLARLLLLSRAALTWEKLWPGLWPALLVIGVFTVVALLDLLSWTPGPAHAVFLAADGGFAAFEAHRLARVEAAGPDALSDALLLMFASLVDGD